MTTSPTTSSLGPRMTARREEFLMQAERLVSRPLAERFLGSVGSGRVVPTYGNASLDANLSSQLSETAKKLATAVAKLER